MATIGDIYGAECPQCEALITDLWDFGVPLDAGAVITCPFCGEPFIVTERKDHFLVLEECSVN